VTNPSVEYKNCDPLSNEEIDDMLSEADKIEQEYFRLRAKALVGIAKKFGKRRSEIAALERNDLKVENDQLLVTFTLRKKHKKGLFQYLRSLEKNNPSALDRPLSQLKLEWKEWTMTEQGYRINEEKPF
jgi:integrase